MPLQREKQRKIEDLINKVAALQSENAAYISHVRFIQRSQRSISLSGIL